MRSGLRRLVLAVACLASWTVQATDPRRGQHLFMTPPAAGELACADCHSDNPVANNFGNIWSGRNAVSMIERAVAMNTGGMGVFSRYYSAADLADIASYLGNSPVRLAFAETAVGQRSLPQQVVVSASTKRGVERLSVQLEGDFQQVSAPCPPQLPRFGKCVVELVFAPTEGGPRSGRLLIDHDGLPTPAAVPLSGMGRARPPAVVTLKPTALDFGTAAPGTDSPAQRLRLSNHSPQPLTLGVIDLKSPFFAIDGGDCHAGRVLRTGGFCVLSLRFLPDAAGEQEGLLRLHHDGVGGFSEFALRGRAGAQAGALLQLSQRVLRFAATGERAVLRLHNGGPRPVRLGGVEFSNSGFTLQPGGCAAAMVLPVGAGCDLAVVRVDGPAAGELRVAHDGQGEPERVVLVSRPVPNTPGDTAIPLVIDEGALVLAAGQRQVLRLANRGAEPLPLAAPQVIGHPPARVVGGTCGVGETLAPSSSCTLELLGLPVALGPLPRGHFRFEAGGFAALLAIEPALPEATSISADLDQRPAPAAGRLALWPEDIVFSAAPGVTGGRQRVWLQNTGAGVLSLRGIGLQGSAFGLQRPGRDGCLDEGFDLLPGQGCAVDVLWTAGLDVRFGGELQVAVEGEDQPRRVPLAVAEPASARSNQGAGGALDPVALTGLCLLVAALGALRVRRRRRAPAESGHV